MYELSQKTPRYNESTLLGPSLNWLDRHAGVTAAAIITAYFLRMGLIIIGLMTVFSNFGIEWSHPDGESENPVFVFIGIPLMLSEYLFMHFFCIGIDRFYLKKNQT